LSTIHIPLIRSYCVL